MKNDLRILIVEDERPVATIMAEVLSQAGCDVVLADTGKRGMDVAHESKFDLAVLDVKLPDTTGFEIADDLKQRHISRKTPIVFISGEPCEEDRQRSQKLGAADYITKPFDVRDFAKRILSHLQATPVHA